MKKELKAFRILTLLVFVAALLYVYAGMPERVGVDFTEDGTFTEFVSKRAFFYGSLGFAFVANIVFMAFAELLARSQKGTFAASIQSWLGGFHGIVNLIMVISVLFLGILNNPDHAGAQLTVLVYLAPLLLLIATVWLFVILFRKNAK
ncbi:MAG: hypothetical protein MI784_12725 [Cytophagales bacterium]|nr:hypothetical protein [Cytophagales bacterium]